MVKLAGIFSYFSPVRVLLIGDFLLDRYTHGSVGRISPEAPVPILKVENRHSLPGGAGNVVVNLLSLGAKVLAVGRKGDDKPGDILTKSLLEEGADISSFFTQDDYPTPVKNRLIADSQQILRVDTETIIDTPQVLQDEIIESLPSLCEKVDVIAISDYAKGFLSKCLIQEVIKTAKSLDIPVIIDPKGKDFTKYKGATLIKPNQSEAYVAANLSNSDSLEKVAEVLLEQTQCESLLITRSQDGISLFQPGIERKDFSVQTKEVKDVTGAGDTVLAILALALGNKIDLTQAVQVANIAASIAIEQLGCARITLADLARRLLKFDADNKIFDEAHLYALTQVLRGSEFSVLSIDSKQGVTTAFFGLLQKLSSRKNHELILYIKDPNPEESFVELLSSIKEVGFIILQKESLQHLCDTIHPNEVYEMQNDQVIIHDHAKDLLRSLANVQKEKVQ